MPLTDVPSFDHHRLNSFEERLRQVQANITAVQRSHQDLQRSVDGLRGVTNASTRWKPAWKP